jgi:hippurate hydrolase
MPFWNEGEFYFNDNSFMASSDSLDIEVTGIGGHGAIPDKAVDATLIVCYVGTTFQTILSRNVSPFEKVVITIGSIQSGEA